MKWENKTILVISPHPDDVELGCGGTLAKLSNKGAEIHYISMADCGDELYADYCSQDLINECHKANSIINIPKEHNYMWRLPNKRLPTYRQEVLENIEEIKKRVLPDMVFIPSLNDLHQDHQTVSIEAIRVFKNSCSILGYEEIWNMLKSNNNLYFSLTEDNISKKMDMINCYKSQIYKGRDYLKEEYIKSIARTRGLQIGKKYAEAFEVIRWIME